MGLNRKNDPRLRAERITNRNGVKTTVYRLRPLQPTVAARRRGRWARSRAAARAVRAWYASVGVTPEPKNTAVPVERPKSERQIVRDRYDAWLLAHGYDQGGKNTQGFTPWGGHAALTAADGSLTHPLTGKPWAPTGFLSSGLHAKTGTYYDQDGVDAKGFMKPDAEGRRIHVGTGTVFDLSRPPRTWDGDDEATHWAKYVEWRTPEAEAEIAEAKRSHAEAVARIDETIRIERKMERMGLAA